MKNFSALTVISLAVVCDVGFISPASAQYPDKPIQLISPHASGGLPGSLSQLVGKLFGEERDQAVIVETKPRTNGNNSSGLGSHIRACYMRTIKEQCLPEQFYWQDIFE